MDSRSLSEAMLAIADLMIAVGKAPVNQKPGPVVHDVDARWKVVLNGHREPVKYGEKNEIEVPPFHCYVEFNGWPAGLLDPFGGWLVAGTLANEETFVAAVKHATEKTRGGSR